MKQPPKARSTIIVRWHPKASELEGLQPDEIADARAFVRSLRNLSKVEIDERLKRRSERKVVQREQFCPRGALRMIFYWGKAGTLWFLGAFVKNNNRQGERYADRILQRTVDVDQHDRKRTK